jgi:hypothetical protein
MAKGQLTFKETDITRAFRAAKKAGVVVQIKVDLEHKVMTIMPVKPYAADKIDNPWDEVLPNGKDAEIP